MCTTDDATKKINRARVNKEEDWVSARKDLLEAAEIHLSLSLDKTDEHKAKHNLQKAEELFDQAMKIGPQEAKPTIATTTGGPAARPAQQAGEADDQFTPQHKPSLSLDDVGGLEELKEEIRFKIIEPLLHPNVFAHYGKKAGGGILLYGPPGCGKSLIAEATAGEAGATFFHVKPSQIKSKYVGEAEKNIAELFRLARKHQPSIIFFDEFETLGGDRHETSANERGAITQLLTETDGLGTKDQQILLLAATNEPWAIDVALRREGRFGTTLFVPPPDRDARKEIFKIHLKGRPLERDIDAKELLDMTDGLSGADVRSICERAADIPLREYFTTSEMRPIRMTDFTAAGEKQQSIVGQWFSKASGILTARGDMEAFPELSERLVAVNEMVA